MEQPWIDILETPPAEGQRVLVRLLGGAVRIAEYSRFNYNCWAIRHWKAMPDNNNNAKFRV